MIWSLYRPVTERYRFFIKGYIPLPSVRDRDTIVTCVTERYIRNLRIFENLNKKLMNMLTNNNFMLN